MQKIFVQRRKFHFFVLQCTLTSSKGQIELPEIIRQTNDIMNITMSNYFNQFLVISITHEMNT